MKTWLLLDLYGTAVQVDWASVRHRLAAAGVLEGTVLREAMKRESHHRLTGLAATPEEEWARICREAEMDTGRLPAVLARVEVSAMSDAWREVDGVRALVGRLRDSGVRLAIASNCYRSTEQVLSDKGWTRAVDALLLSCRLGVVKPQAAFFDAALRLIEASPADCVFVDDLPENCAAARRCGIDAVVADPAGDFVESVRSSFGPA